MGFLVFFATLLELRLLVGVFVVVFFNMAFIHVFQQEELNEKVAVHSALRIIGSLVMIMLMVDTSYFSSFGCFFL